MLKIFAGNSNKPLAQAIVERLGQKLGRANVGTFRDGEIRVHIEESVRGADVFVIQATCPPVNDNLMELLIVLDALRRASSKRITAVIPYMGYARQDRKHASREPITAKLVADLLTASGPHKILFLDLHADQIQGFFNMPVDNLLPDSLIIEYLKEKDLKPQDTVIVTPDVGGATRARRIAKHVDAKIALLETRKDGDKYVTNVVGEISENAVIVDDMIDTGNRLVSACMKLKEHGAKRIFACATHAVLSGDMQKIQASPVEEVMVTDSIPVPETKKIPKLRILSIAPLVAEAIRRIHNEESIATLFPGYPMTN